MAKEIKEKEIKEEKKTKPQVKPEAEREAAKEAAEKAKKEEAAKAEALKKEAVKADAPKKEASAKSEKAPKAPKAPKRRKSIEAQTERKKAVIDFLKSLIVPLVFCAIIGAFVYFVMHFVNPAVVTEPVAPYGFDGQEDPLVMETDELLFTMDPTTTFFTVTHKATGKVWSSYIEDANTDSKALKNEKGKMQSNVLLSYAVTTGLETVYDSKTFSVDNGVYSVEQGEDGSIKLFYSLGNIEREYQIPTVIRVSDMDALKAQLDNKTADLVRDVYKKYDINNLKPSDNKEELLENYPILATEPIYVLRDNTKENRKVQLENAFADIYSYEQYLADKELNNSSKTSENPVFNLEMDFRLEGGDMVVEIPFDSIEYDPSTPVYNVTPLPYFGAGSKTDTGFLFVPEGGGALINYNNGKTAQSDYYANVYGWDMDVRREYVIHNTRAYFNVFGQSCGNDSYICIMEDGSSYASVKAFVSGRTNDYNYVDAMYQLCTREQYDISDLANSDVYAYLPQLPAGEKIVQRYRFVDSSDYVDMAYAYRDYLENKYGDYMSLNSDKNAPVSVEMLGAVDKVQQVLGVPVSRPLKLTSFKEAQTIIEDLDAQNIGTLSVKLVGWCNGGVQQKILNNVKLVRAMGSAKDLNNLSSMSETLGVNLYLNGITQYEHDSDIFDGFNSYRDAARLLTRERAELYNYSHVTYEAREGFKSYYLLHTTLAMKMADNLVAAAGQYKTGVSFEDLGMDLSSDFYRKETHSRENVKALQCGLLQSLDDKKVMINMGNDYAIPYVDMVTNMDLRGSGYTVLDAEVPFYQIAVHGYIDYTGAPINICGDDVEELLSCAEYGAGLNFTLMSENAFVLQKTLYPEYYGCEYAAWRDRMIEICQRYNRELGHTFDQEMTDHEILNDYVRSTTYADGTTVYVNYSFADEYTAEDGTVVPVRNYVVVK
ncbi:MAG: hypothetical protein J6O73_04185 [Lachnospiraceae bacterium]|nr:hypothetical protein [Lachnospiraceae bacterium]